MREYRKHLWDSHWVLWEHLRVAAAQLWEARGFLKEVTSKPTFIRGLRESVAKGLAG